MRGGEVNATAEPASLYSPSWISVLSLSVSAPVSSLAASVWLCLCVALLTLLMWMPLCVLCAAVDAPVCAALCSFFSFRVYIVTTVEIVIATDRGMQHDDGSPTIEEMRPSLQLVVGDGVEEVVVAGIEHGVDHGTGHAEHGGTAILNLYVELASALLGVGDLGVPRVASRNYVLFSVVARGEVLWATGVLGGRHRDELRNAAEECDLGQAERRHVGERGEAHAVLEHAAERHLAREVQAPGEGDA